MQEVIDDLLLNGLRIIRPLSGAFRYGTDGVLLANWASSQINASPVVSRCRKINSRLEITDIGTGTCIIPILLSGKIELEREKIHINAVEIQPEIAEMARRSVCLNNLESTIEVRNEDILRTEIESGTQDFITINPPYVRCGSGIQNQNDENTQARMEVNGTIEEILQKAGKLLKQRGMLFVINKADRLTDTLCAMREAKIEPSVVQMVETKRGAAPELFLAMGIRCGGKNLRVLPNIVLDEPVKV